MPYALSLREILQENFHFGTAGGQQVERLRQSTVAAEQKITHGRASRALKKKHPSKPTSTDAAWHLAVFEVI